MIAPLLRRGLVVGVLAGLLAGVFAFVVGEPLVQDAIEIEGSASARASVAPVLAQVGDVVVGRPGQRLGLFVATALYGGCVGVLFAVAFALLRGRGAPRDDWQLAVRLAAALFTALVLVPFLKYPASPPGVGDPDTVGARTGVYLAILAGSLLSLLAAARVAWRVADVAAPWRAPVLGAATFAVLAAFLAVVLPGVDEVPAAFPAQLLWEFRLSALGTQVVLWTALGAGFGVATLRAAGARTARLGAAS